MAEAMPGTPRLSLAEWAVLGVLDEGPNHGFAIAALTATGGDLGRVWQIPRPVVYRSLARLAEAGLISADGVEPGHGPQRTRYVITGRGSAAVRQWLATPVEHVRDVRSHLLVKLALIHRRGDDTQILLERQRGTLEPIAAAMAEEDLGAGGFDAMLLAWRRATVAATMGFLDEMTRSRPGASTARVRAGGASAPRSARSAGRTG
jgi:DNA-binding PadR family transcriptional regulator